jgi:hypothetical protein
MKLKDPIHKCEFPDSDVIKSAVYDEAKKTLDITFKKNKRVYRYFRVPARTFNSIRLSDSAGNYFNEKIMNHFRCEEV